MKKKKKSKWALRGGNAHSKCLKIAWYIFDIGKSFYSFCTM